MTRPPRPSNEHLLNGAVARRVFGWIGPLEGLAAMSCFLFAYWLAGWRPGDPLAGSGTLYEQATTMTLAGIVMAQVGAGLAWRTNTLSLRSIGLWSNRLLLAGIAVEIAMIALLACVPGIDDVFHTGDLEVWHWLFLLVRPVLVVGAEELRKAIVRRSPGRGATPRP